MYICSICKSKILVVDSKAIRICEHINAPILANMKAKVYGVSKVN